MPPSRPSETTAGRMYTDADVASPAPSAPCAGARTQHRPTRAAHQRGTAPPGRRAGRECGAAAGPDSGDASSMRPRSPPRSRATTRQPSTSEIGSTRRGPAPARAAPRRADAHAGAGGRRLAPPAREHRAGAPDVLDRAEHSRLLPARVRATRTCRRGCSLRRPQANATNRDARRGDACGQQRPGRRLSRPRSSRRRNCRERGARRRPGAGPGVDQRRRRGRATERELRTIVRDLPNGRRAMGGRTRRRASRLDHHPAGPIFADYNAYQQELVRLGGRIA